MVANPASSIQTEREIDQKKISERLGVIERRPERLKRLMNLIEKAPSIRTFPLQPLPGCDGRALCDGTITCGLLEPGNKVRHQFNTFSLRP